MKIINIIENIEEELLEIPVISHTHSGALRTVRRGKTLVEIIVHQVCDIVRNPLSFLWESPNKFSR
jgi:citrate lyase alpha subunit